MNGLSLDLKVIFLLKKKLFKVPKRNENLLAFELFNGLYEIKTVYKIKSSKVETNPTSEYDKNCFNVLPKKFLFLEFNFLIIYFNLLNGC